jgi:hypothetical protein
MSKTCRNVLGVLLVLLVLWQPGSGFAGTEDGKRAKVPDERGSGAVQQRREALRAALQAQRTATDAPPQNANSHANRHLSPEEKAELRHQLSQQRRTAKNGAL